jgi:hypothetical protein
MWRPKFISSVNFTHIYETTHNDNYSSWPMLLLSIKVLRITWKKLLKLWPTRLWHYAVLYEDTTILETHAAFEGLVPRRHVNHWDDNVTGVYRKTAMEVTKQSHGRKKGS